MIYIPIGYPLFVSDDVCIIEKSSSHVHLSRKELASWYTMISPKHNQDDTIIKILIEKNLLLLGNSYSEFLNQLMPLNAVRQGIGFYDNINNRYAIGLGDVKIVFHINDIQKYIWEKSYGNNTLKDIYNELENTNERDFVEAIRGLFGCALLFLR